MIAHAWWLGSFVGVVLLLAVGCGSSDRSLLPLRVSGSMKLQVFDQGREVVDRALSVVQLEAVKTWAGTLDDQLLNTSIQTYVPQVMVRCEGWNANFSGKLVILNAQDRGGEWHQYEWPARSADLMLVEVIRRPELGTTGIRDRQL